ncbi:hypothetical protein [Streptomyces achromogenes]|uniref:hypothetical protein n=1 Tax=Streptomyces achromogenes TaxID=67255 RepID=UPI0036CCBF8C
MIHPSKATRRSCPRSPFTRALLGGRLPRPARQAEPNTTVPTATADIGYGLGFSWFRLPCGQWVWSHNGAVLGYFSP